MDDPWAAFTAARLDEDEAMARDLLRAHPGPWRVGLPAEVRDSGGDVVVVDEYHWSPMPHIARHDPARVLREVAAKRALVAHCRDELATEYEPGDGEYMEGSIAASRADASIILRHLAAAWSDHGDYPGTAVAP